MQAIKEEKEPELEEITSEINIKDENYETETEESCNDDKFDVESSVAAFEIKIEAPDETSNNNGTNLCNIKDPLDITSLVKKEKFDNDDIRNDRYEVLGEK